ncbi:MAG: ATP-dependent helicase [Synergistes jonesii]|uniref:ATP-dependent helicase n=1 Tax=Synergistes jonesii TaxID=2754 RepID=UPI002A75DA0B|nr:ATP-dependent helicase [Synergistes jonesii]MDY2985020.1 ATP-dependent helicase [Synergistes jonesii]
MAIEITSDDIFSSDMLLKHAKIYAGPGAGKTHFLVENVKNIVTTNPLITRSRARKVLCVTYTNAAVDEIKRRLDRFTDHVEVHTIHGFIIEHIISPFQQDLKEIMKSDFGISVSGKGKISSQVEGLGILHGVDKSDIYNFVRKTNSVEFLQDDLGYSKKAMGEIEVDNAAFVDSIANETPRQILKVPSQIDERHVEPIKKYIWSVIKKLTHNEILYFGYRILERNPTALYAIRVKFPFIFVDEFQDTNPLQTLLIKLIGEKSTTIGIVGDLAQSIYSFQGAHPTDFKNFSIIGNREVTEYVINGNRRSIRNVVNFCNYLRQSDRDVAQVSIRPYDSEDEKAKAESTKIHFLIEKTEKVQKTIQEVIKSDGVVLTRAWAAAFDYIQGVDESQAKLLKNIYNSYYNSPIQLRDEIAEHNNVTWVRAFRFIFGLWKSYLNGSFIDIIGALKLYSAFDTRKITPKVVFQIKKISDFVFSDVNEQSYTCNVIESFNAEIKKPEFKTLKESIFEPDFIIPIFDELESEKLKTAVAGLLWGTSYKLFTEVFSENSRYMTVHQAKGLEWNKVIVSVTPNKFDKIKIADMYSKPQLMDESPSDEFTRMYYVACSRAKEDLYIHISSGCTVAGLQTSINAFIESTGNDFAYEFIIL